MNEELLAFRKSVNIKSDMSLNDMKGFYPG